MGGALCQKLAIKILNIARGTTDPGHTLYNLNKFSDRNQFEGGVTYVGSKFDQEVVTYKCSNFGYQVASLALVTNLATRWRHLRWFQFWPPGGTTCISYKFGHQVAPLAHCLWLPYWHNQLVLSCFLHQPESHQLSLKKVSLVRDTRTHRSNPMYTWIR